MTAFVLMVRSIRVIIKHKQAHLHEFTQTHRDKGCVYVCFNIKGDKIIY